MEQKALFELQDLIKNTNLKLLDALKHSGSDNGYRLSQNISDAKSITKYFIAEYGAIKFNFDIDMKLDKLVSQTIAEVNIKLQNIETSTLNDCQVFLNFFSNKISSINIILIKDYSLPDNE